WRIWVIRNPFATRFHCQHVVSASIASEPIQEEVESGESVVIPWWRLIRTGAPDVEARTPPSGEASWSALPERSDGCRVGPDRADDSAGPARWKTPRCECP